MRTGPSRRPADWPRGLSSSMMLLRMILPGPALCSRHTMPACGVDFKTHGAVNPTQPRNMAEDSTSGFVFGPGRNHPKSQNLLAKGADFGAVRRPTGRGRTWVLQAVLGIRNSSFLNAKKRRHPAVAPLEKAVVPRHGSSIAAASWQGPVSPVRAVVQRSRTNSMYSVQPTRRPLQQIMAME